MPLTNAQVKHLRGRCHALKPVVTVAANGISDNVYAEIETALDHHELIKVKLRDERERRREWIEEISRRSGAELVQSIGQVACFYRPNPEKRVIELPA